MVCQRELGRALDKTEQTSNWRRRPLSKRQMAYAAVDSEVLVELYERWHATAPDQGLDRLADEWRGELPADEAR